MGNRGQSATHLQKTKAEMKISSHVTGLVEVCKQNSGIPNWFPAALPDPQCKTEAKFGRSNTQWHGGFKSPNRDSSKRGPSASQLGMEVAGFPSTTRGSHPHPQTNSSQPFRGLVRSPTSLPTSEALLSAAGRPGRVN